MFTIEIRINGSQIGHIYGHNTGPKNDGNCKYEYEYYETETGKVVSGNVAHSQDDKIRRLIVKILEDADRELLE